MFPLQVLLRRGSPSISSKIGELPEFEYRNQLFFELVGSDKQLKIDFAVAMKELLEPITSVKILHEHLIEPDLSIESNLQQEITDFKKELLDTHHDVDVLISVQSVFDLSHQVSSSVSELWSQNEIRKSINFLDKYYNELLDIEYLENRYPRSTKTQVKTAVYFDESNRQFIAQRGINALVKDTLLQIKNRTIECPSWKCLFEMVSKWNHEQTDAGNDHDNSHNNDKKPV